MSNTTYTSDVLDHEPTTDRIFVGIIGVIGIFLNTATLVVILDNFTRIFSKAEAVLVTNLCAADLSMSAGGLLWAIFPVGYYPRGLVLTLHCLMWIAVSASFLTLSCMAVERLLVVVNPVKAQRMLKRTFACVCCAVIWLISIVGGSMIVVNPLIAQCAMTVMFEASLIATIACYIRIYFTVTKLSRDGFHAAAHYNKNNANLRIEVEENEPALHHRVAVRQESRITNLVFLLIVVLGVTVLPYMVLLQVALAHRLSCVECGWTPSMMIAIDILFPIEMLNFVINPVVYAWRLPKFRQASRRTFSKLICCKKWKANAEATVRVDHSYSSSSDSVPRSPATIFTGGNTLAEAFNNNKHS
jgi:hypothetical protein